MTIWGTHRDLPLSAVTSALRAVLCLPALLITSTAAKEDMRPAALSLAEKVADGRPWKVNLVESDQDMEMALFPGGSGVTNGVLAPTPRWRPTADGLCLKPSFIMSERCLALVVRPNGYDGIKDGKLFIEFRR